MTLTSKEIWDSFFTLGLICKCSHSHAEHPQGRIFSSTPRPTVTHCSKCSCEGFKEADNLDYAEWIANDLIE